METVIGCAHADGAKILFSAPAIEGDVFRDVVDIYACGTGSYFSALLPGYVRKLVEDGKDDLYFVLARSFMSGGGRCGGAPHRDDPPSEQFDIAFCLPVEALTPEILEDIEEMFRCGGGRFAAPFSRGSGPGPKGHGPKGRGHGRK